MRDLSGGVERALQFADGDAEFFRAAEQPDDVGGLAVGRQRWNLQGIGYHELCVAVLGEFLQQLVEDLTRFGAEAFEEILARGFHALCALAARAQRCVEGEVAEQVERVGLLLVQARGQLGEVDAVCVQLRDDFRALAGIGPAGAQLARIVPAGFYFEGQSAPTQMRNSAAARFGAKQHVVAGMVDTSGYSADVRSRYEGFLIIDTAMKVGGQELATGAYGFGFTEGNKFTVSDVGGNQIFSVETEPDRNLRRPRPLMMLRGAGGVRLYSGRRYVTIAAR